MPRRFKRPGRAKRIDTPLAVRRIGLMLAILAVVRFASAQSAQAAEQNILRKFAGNREAVSFTLAAGLGLFGAADEGRAGEDASPRPPAEDEDEPALSGEEPEKGTAAELPYYTVPQELWYTAAQTAPPPADEETRPYIDYAAAAAGIRIKNGTGLEPDTAELLSSKPALAGARVLIIHTHGSEAFDPAGDPYEASDTMRTEDKSHSVIKVGDVLAQTLESRGVAVIHDREIYDYPSYTGSYTRSAAAIQAYLETYPDIGVVIDLHRDALEDGSGNVYSTRVDIGGEKCAQVMLICGTNWSGLKHDGWRENLRFALHLQAAMDTEYPGLARPLNISKYRYNQHYTTGSLIAEIGCTGNTLAEAEAAARAFGQTLADVLEDIAQT